MSDIVIFEKVTVIHPTGVTNATFALHVPWQAERATRMIAEGYQVSRRWQVTLPACTIVELAN